MLMTIKKLELRRETVKEFRVKTAIKAGIAKPKDPPEVSSPGSIKINATDTPDSGGGGADPGQA